MSAGEGYAFMDLWACQTAQAWSPRRTQSFILSRRRRSSQILASIALLDRLHNLLRRTYPLYLEKRASKEEREGGRGDVDVEDSVDAIVAADHFNRHGEASAGSVQKNAGQQRHR